MNSMLTSLVVNYRQRMSGELSVDGALGGLQLALAAAAGRRGLPAADGARVRPLSFRTPHYRHPLYIST